jgi:hypothetical protein
MKFYSHKDCGRLGYKTKCKKYKWFGFAGNYIAESFIHWTGGSYFSTIIITDLNWRVRKEDKHWYQYKRHFKTAWEAKRWCKFIMGNPPNYIEENWGIKPIK